MLVTQCLCNTHRYMQVTCDWCFHRAGTNRPSPAPHLIYLWSGDRITEKSHWTPLFTYKMYCVGTEVWAATFPIGSFAFSKTVQLTDSEYQICMKYFVKIFLNVGIVNFNYYREYYIYSIYLSWYHCIMMINSGKPSFIPERQYNIHVSQFMKFHYNIYRKFIRTIL